MGILKRQAEDAKDGKKARRFRREIPESEGANWENVEPQILWMAIRAVAMNGGALRLGNTRDGGAYAIGVYGDGAKPYTEYLRPSEDLNEFFTDLIEAFNEETPIQAERTAGKTGSKPQEGLGKTKGTPRKGIATDSEE